MRLFLSGSSRAADRARSVAASIDAIGGVEIVSRWFADAEAWSGSDRRLPRSKRIELADEYESLIRSADVFGLLKSAGFSGSLVEYGIAIGAGVSHVIVTGDELRRTLFTELADSLHASDLEGVAVVKRLAREERARVARGATVGRLGARSVRS